MMKEVGPVKRQGEVEIEVAIEVAIETEIRSGKMQASTKLWDQGATRSLKTDAC